MWTRFVLAGLMVSVGWCGGLAAQEMGSGLVAAGAELRVLAEGFSFVEGPTPDSDGNIFFSDIPNNRIHRWSVDGVLTTVREESGGANGLLFDSEGNLFACEGNAQRVTSMAPDGTVTSLFDSFEGKRLNSPNDLWFDAKGGFYFTDPRYQFFTYPMELDMEGVYYVSPDRASITRVVDDMTKPNGVIGTRDGKTLYVADTGTMKVYSFEVRDDATLGPKREFAPQGSDGMTMDERGNLYLTWVGGVSVFSPAGERIERIKMPKMPANATFGGPDGKTLFITARETLYAIDMAVAGQPLR